MVIICGHIVFGGITFRLLLFFLFATGYLDKFCRRPEPPIILSRSKLHHWPSAYHFAWIFSSFTFPLTTRLSLSLVVYTHWVSLDASIILWTPINIEPCLRIPFIWWATTQNTVSVSGCWWFPINYTKQMDQEEDKVSRFKNKFTHRAL